MVDLQQKLKLLPDEPGVYIMKNDKNEIIYVGKAVSLKNRVRQYFQNSKNHPPKVRAMVNNIADFEYIITDSELEALILECNLIKENRPKYNILLRDDKNYPYIRITSEKYPRIMFTRKVVKDGSKYYGPYSSAYAVRETIDVIRKMFPIRSCNIDIEKKAGKIRECLYYHIGKCSAPCTGRISQEEYQKICEDVSMFLDGKQDKLIDMLKEEMKLAADNLDFERAARLRDQISAIEKLMEKQKVLKLDMGDVDVVALARNGNRTCVQVFFIRKGKLVDRDSHILKDTEEMEDGEIMAAFLKQYYSEVSFIPREVLLMCPTGEEELLSRWLSERRGSKVKVFVPKRGEKLDLVKMVKNNAEETLNKTIALSNSDKKKDRVVTDKASIELADALGLEKPPYRLEAYDISNIQGYESVASMVVFEDGRPKKSDYRRFKIKTVSGPDDYSSMQEVIIRRFEHSKREDDDKFAVLPDLILIDGGHGHVNAILEVLKDMKVDIPVCGMVKDDKHKTRGLIYMGGEVGLPITSRAFKLIARIQEEAHRFAITYHRVLRDKAVTKSILDDIIGIGEARKKALLSHFGSIEKIKNATLDELKKVKGMNSKTALSVYEYFHRQGVEKDKGD
ncbi:Excinuclease ABC subunit C [Caldanaerobius fijiensis DSM 17918]|uniref:UvrABC system protein C n=1 Tax=Caldanaerobius fijiensis DSM 17918 TaxID=1121256 RepID=A0A1M5B1C1_9THEO|nr:excinuclease ABC subunit UvrC [Caldanaerobius fijiensis]SHF36230.1 Excinuclease ABC subunit C [Caldanaerobius fijiensis DSM 17918]